MVEYSTVQHHVHLGPPVEAGHRGPQSLALVQARLEVLHLVELGRRHLPLLPHHLHHLAITTINIEKKNKFPLNWRKWLNVV